MGMCRICGCLVATRDVKEVRIAGRDHPVCNACADKKIPMLSGLPGAAIGGHDV